ncbi:MAG: hypothetical protein AAB263_09330 [Planctomycetota bacterium]
MPSIPLPLLVALAAFLAVGLTGAILLIGGVAVRRLRLPADPPEAVTFDPPSPDLLPAGDPTAARQRAAHYADIAARGAQARTTVEVSREAKDLAEWIAANNPSRAADARAAAAEADNAAQRAKHAFAVGDVTDLAAAALAAATAAQRIQGMTAGIPDWRIAERRKLLWLTLLLLATLAFAVAVMCLH